MKKTILLIYIIVFFALSIVPAALTPFGIGLGSYEKRQLSQMPEFINESGFNADFTDQFNDYFNDNFGLRSYMIKVWSGLNYYLLGTSASSKALAGKDGWLFLTETLDDYTRTNTLSDQQISDIASKLLDIQNRVEENGGEFIFVAAPNKNSIYPEFMPSNIIVLGNENNYSLLMKKLDELGVNHTDLKASFSDQKESGLLYHKLDTHWNGYGAWLAFNEIMDCAGVEAELDIAGFDEAADWQGDLLNMVFPGSKRLDKQMYPGMDTNYSFDNPTVREDDVDITTVSEINNSSILLYRDSFTNQLLQYISNSFGQARYLRGAPYDLSMIDSEAPDLVIIEIAERNIPELLNNLDISD